MMPFKMFWMTTVTSGADSEQPEAAWTEGGTLGLPQTPPAVVSAKAGRAVKDRQAMIAAVISLMGLDFIWYSFNQRFRLDLIRRG